MRRSPMPEQAAVAIKGAKPATFPEAPHWYAVWTRSHFEQVVSDQLAARGFELFLPKAPTWSRRARGPRAVEAPLFPGYLFVHHALDKHAHVEILKTRGVVRVLGQPPDHATPIDEDQIAAVQRVVRAGLPVFPYKLPAAGDRVRIVGGPLAGVHGVFLHQRMDKGLLVVSVNLLQRSVAVEIDCGNVEAA
jgi:transcription antitermination factor NusG